MHTYAATYITGWGSIVEAALLTSIPDMEVVGHDDGLIVFKTAEKYENLLHISYINNIFYCFLYDPLLGNEKSVHSIVKAITQKTAFSRLPGKTFRLMVMQGSKLVHVTREITNRLKEKVSKQTGLTFSPLNANTELWVLVRNNGSVMFGYKQEERVEKIHLHKGELRPKVAELLIMASDPQPEDVFLDPFAGYGAIPKARINLEPYKQIILCDKDKEALEVLRKKFKNVKNVEIHAGDNKKLPFVKEESVEVIVTDPPWGMYEEMDIDIAVFYSRMLKDFDRVLKNEGKVVVLTGQPEALNKALTEHASFQIQQELTTLVNGKKATVMVMKKAQTL